jgi:hypothetical protein
MTGNCSCPNATCPNHGDCEACTSSHVSKGYLSYCAFQTILPALRGILDASPPSEASEKLEALIAPQLEAYEKLKARHGLSQEELDRRLACFADSGTS